MLRFTETVLRDANQSLAATRMARADFESVLGEMDQVGYYSVECWGGATFDACLRYLDEDPWERLRLIRKNMPHTKLQMLLRGQNLLGYRHYPTEIVRDFVRCSIQNGIDIIRIFDALNDLDNIRDAVKATLDFGGEPSCALCYTVSPVHQVSDFVRQAVAMQQLGATSICIKDMSGSLMPDTAYELVSALKNELSVPVVLHTHNSSGLAQMTCLKAIEAGVDVIDTAISSFSCGTSQAPTETMALVAKQFGRTVNLDMNRLTKINQHFKKVFDKMMEESTINYHSMQTDPQCLITQVPGGMYSNLLAQMKARGMMDQLDAVLQEVPRVRKDLGYPPLVTPISQMVGTQATANVIAGERYQVVINEVKDYVAGKYGRAPGTIDEDVKQLILSQGPAPAKSEQSDLEIKRECLEKGCSMEDMLTHVTYPQLAKKFFARDPDNEFTYHCARHEQRADEQLVRLTQMEDDLLALFHAIISRFDDLDVKDIDIKGIYQYR